MTRRPNKRFPGVRVRAVQSVLDDAGQHGSSWQATMSIATRSGCSATTLNDWAKTVTRGAPSLQSIVKSVIWHPTSNTLPATGPVDELDS